MKIKGTCVCHPCRDKKVIFQKKGAVFGVRIKNPGIKNYTIIKRLILNYLPVYELHITTQGRPRILDHFKCVLEDE